MVYEPGTDTFLVGDQTQLLRLPRSGGPVQVAGTGFGVINGLTFDSQGQLFVADDSGVIWQMIATKPCDFSSDGFCDVTDLDLMQSLGPLAPGVPAVGNEEFDLNGDGSIDLTDRDQWLADAAIENSLASPYKLGDANIDGVVDGQDFIAWNGSKFTSDLLWSHGDWNADGVVDGQDFILWNGNKFTSSDGVSAVPEPAAGILSIALLISLAAVRQR